MKPVRHQHADFIAKAKTRPGFVEAYEELELEYALASQMLKARAKAGLTQDAAAVDCDLQVKLVPHKAG